jgi:hypothetical protein
MRKYDLEAMLDEIRREAAGGGAAREPEKKKVLTQDEIKAMMKARRKPAAPRPSGDP